MAKAQAVVVGAGPGLSASLARRLAARGLGLTLAARDTSDLGTLAAETGARLVDMDARDPAAMAALFAALPGPLALAAYNPSARQRAPLVELDPEAVRHALEVTAFGAFLMGREAAWLMLGNPGPHRGTILFTGASAGVKGFARSAPFAMGKFAQRGLAQSMARELHPEGIHVAWVNIDGAIGDREEAPDRLNPDSIADAYLWLHDQPVSTWTDELTLRPMAEGF